MVETKRELIIGTILITLGFTIIFIIYPIIHIFITGDSISTTNYLEVIESTFRITFLLMIVISAVSTRVRVTFIKRCYKLFIIEAIICEIFISLFAPVGLIFNLLIKILSIVALSFGAIGIILQEDEKVREDWEIRRGYTTTGSIIMVIFVIILSLYLIFFIFIPYFSGLPIRRLTLTNLQIPLDFFNIAVSALLYRLSFFLFFISGIATGRNIRKIKGVKQAFFFFFSLFSICLAFLDVVFNITFKWSFLFFFSLYFGFFFSFQSTTFFINTIQASREKGFYISKSTLIIMWFSLLWLILVFFIFENLELLTDFPANVMDWAFLIFICGFGLSFLYREYS